MYEDVAVSENAGLAYMLFETFVVFPSVLFSVSQAERSLALFHSWPHNVYLLMRQSMPARGFSAARI